MLKLVRVSLILIVSFLASAKQVTTTGEAIIGNGVTVEQADAIALNYAKQAALDSMGVFIESQVVVSNNMLVKDEISAITGSLIKSTILKKEKNLVGDQFAVKLTVQCNVDEAVFSQAMTKYMGESTAKKQLQEMASTINELRKQLMQKSISEQSQSQMIVSLNSKQDMLGKYLSAQSLIAGEKAIQAFYKEKIKTLVYGDGIIAATKCVENLKIGKIPLDGNFFQIDGDSDNGNLMKKIRNDFDKIVTDYDKLNLKLKNKLSCFFEIIIPITVILNSQEYQGQYLIDGRVDVINWKPIIKLRGLVDDMGHYHGFENLDDREGWYLPDNMSIDDIIDIDIKVGTPIVKSIYVWNEKLDR